MPVNIQTGWQVARRRFSDDELGRFTAMQSPVSCECLRHMAELVGQLAGFERYSRDCASAGPADAALHRGAVPGSRRPPAPCSRTRCSVSSTTTASRGRELLARINASRFAQIERCDRLECGCLHTEFGQPGLAARDVRPEHRREVVARHQGLAREPFEDRRLKIAEHVRQREDEATMARPDTGEAKPGR